MAIPEGYTFLAKLGIAYEGDYSETTTYEQFDAVYYNGSTYIALVDSPAGPPSDDGTNWRFLAKGFLSQVISNLTATDKNGVIGEAGATVNAQNLIDGMSDDIKDKLDKTGDASDTIVTFEQAAERTNIISGESHKTILGKIKKWFADMTAAAFAQIITSNTDLMATTVSGYLVDALAVKNQFDVVNSNLSVIGSPWGTYFNDKSVNAGSTSIFASLNVPAGMYIVIGMVRSDVENTSGRYFVCINDGIQFQDAVTIHKISSAVIADIVNVADGIINLKVFNESSNVTTGFQGSLKAVRIK